MIQVAFPDLSAVAGWSGTGGTDTSSPYASTTYGWTAGAAAPGAQDDHGDERREHHRHRHDHDRRRLDRAHRPAASTSRAAPGTHPLRPAHPRQRHRRRGRRRRLERDVVERDGGHAHGRHLRHASAAPGGRSRSSAAPTPPSPAAPATATGSSSATGSATRRPPAPQRRREGRHHRAERAGADAVTSRRRTPTSRATTLYYNAQGSNTGTFTVNAHRSDAQSGIQKLGLPERVRDDRRRRRRQLSPYQRHATPGTAPPPPPARRRSPPPTAPAHRHRHLHRHQRHHRPQRPERRPVRRALVHQPLRPAHPRQRHRRRRRHRQRAAASSSAPRPPSPTAPAAPSAAGRPSPSPAAPTPPSPAATATATATASPTTSETPAAPSSASADAKVDTSAPTVASTAPTAVTGAANQYYESGDRTLYFRPAGRRLVHPRTRPPPTPQSGVAQVSFPDVSARPAGRLTGGTDTSSPYASPDATPGPRAQPATRHRPTVTATNGAGLAGSATDHRHRRLDRPHRPDRRPRRRPLVHHPLGPAHPRQRHRRRLRHRHHQRRRRARRGHPHRRQLRHLRHLDDRHPHRRRRHHRPDRQLLPLPLQHLRPRRKRSAPSTASADAKVDTTAPSAPALTLTESSPLSYVSGTTLYYNPRARTPPASPSRHRHRRPVRHRAARLPDRLRRRPAAATPPARTRAPTPGTTPPPPPARRPSQSPTAPAPTAVDLHRHPDTTAPTGQTRRPRRRAPGTPPSPSPLTLDNGTDAGAGIDTSSGVVERDSATLTDGTAAPSAPGRAVTLAGGADTTVTERQLLPLPLHASPTASETPAAVRASADAKIDTSAPGRAER